MHYNCFWEGIKQEEDHESGYSSRSIIFKINFIQTRTTKKIKCSFILYIHSRQHNMTKPRNLITFGCVPGIHVAKHQFNQRCQLKSSHVSRAKELIMFTRQRGRDVVVQPSQKLHNYVDKFVTSYVVVLFCHIALSWVYIKDQAALDFFSCPGLNKIHLQLTYTYTLVVVNLWVNAFVIAL